MKTIDELVISPFPWCVGTGRIYTNVECDGDTVAVGVEEHDARLIAAAPELYDALYDCCEEVNGHDAPRCYGCRRGSDGHCMARGSCAIYKALAKASGEEEK